MASDDRGEVRRTLSRLQAVSTELERSGSLDDLGHLSQLVEEVRSSISRGDLPGAAAALDREETYLQARRAGGQSAAQPPADAGVPVTAPGPVPERESTATHEPAQVPPAPEPPRSRFTVSRELKIRLAVSGALGLLFSLVLAAAAHGRLFYGADYAGIYNPGDFLYRPNVDAALPSFISLLDASNPYVTFYASLAIEGAVAAYCVQLLAFHFAKGRFHGLQLWGTQVACAALYLGNPWILDFGVQSLFMNVLVSTDALVAVFAILFEIVRELSRGAPLSRRTAIWLGLAIGLASPQAFSNLLRFQLLIAIGLLIVAVFLFVEYGPWSKRATGSRRVATRTLARFALFCVPVAALLLAYPLWIATTQYLLQKGVIDTIIASQPSLSMVQYNTFPYVVRLLGKSTFHNFPYAAGYQQLTLQAVASWLWPLFVLGVPIVALLLDGQRFIEWRWIVLIECAAWFSLAWAGASNPPFGFAVGPLSAAIPRSQGALPNYYTQFEPLSWIYSLLAGVSVLWLGRVLHDGISRRSSTASQSGGPPTPGTTRTRLPSYRQVGPAKIATAVFVLILVGLLLCVSIPVVTGDSLSSKGNLRPGGFVIPGEYTELRNVLTRAGGSTLVLPGLESNFETSWGYYGDSAFYPLYLFPATVVTPAYYGPFGILKPSESQSYTNLTTPLRPGTPSNSTSPFTATAKVVNTSTSLQFNWKTRSSNVSWNGEDWVAFTLSSNNSDLLSQALTEGTLWAGVLSEGAHGTNQLASYRLVDSYYTNLENNSTSVRVSLLLPFPGSGTLSLGHVSGLRVWFDTPVARDAVSLSITEFDLYQNSSVSGSWESLLAQYGLQFVLVDTTLVEGTLQPLAYAKLCAAAMVGTQVAQVYWKSTDLSLYQISPP